MNVRKNVQRRSQRRNAGNSVGEYFGDAWSLAKRTAYGLNEIRKLINVEEKQITSVTTSTPCSSDGVMFPLSRVGQGGDYINRIGNSIKLQSIELNARVFMDPDSINTLVRIMIFRDLDNMGTQPTASDLLEYPLQVSAPLSTIKFLNRTRFSILYDELEAIHPGDTSFVLRFKTNHEGHILYLGGAANEASDGKGSLYMLVLSDETTNSPNIAFVSRVVFTDD